MSLFVRNIFIFCILALCCSILPFTTYMYFVGVSLKDLPAPRLSNSFTFNEKMAFLRSKKADIMSFGSSASLKNLNSDTIVKNFHSTSYLNAASWGFTIHDSYELLKVCTEIHKPKSIIMAISMLDFTNLDKIVDHNDLKTYLMTDGYNPIYFKYVNLFYVLMRMSEKKKGNDDKSPFPEESIKYDLYGATPIKGITAKGRKLAEDNNKHILFDLLPHNDYGDIFERNYRYLDSIVAFCQTKKINLYVFHSPIEEGMKKDLEKKMVDKLNAHYNRVEKILGKNGVYYVNANERPWDDSLFVDAFHMNWSGAAIFTQYCFDMVNKIK